MPEITKTTVRNWRSRTPDSRLRRFYESIDCARLFNTRYLLDYTTVDLNEDKGRLALSIVCYIGDDKAKSRRILFDWLLREKCDFNLQDAEGLTLINWLCKNNRPELFDFFIKKCEMDIDYTTPDAEQDTPLMHATRTGNVEMVREILRVHSKFGITVDTQNKDGLTAYAEAVRLNFRDIAKLLEEEGKASTNVFVEPLWSLKTYDHCFKDVLNESTPVHESEVMDAQKKKEHKNTKKHSIAKIIKLDNHIENNKTVNKKKNIISIEPPKPMISGGRKISRSRRKTTIERKESLSTPAQTSTPRKPSVSAPTILSPSRERKESRARKDSKAVMERLKKISISTTGEAIMENSSLQEKQNVENRVSRKQETSRNIRNNSNRRNTRNSDASNGSVWSNCKTNRSGESGEQQCLGSAPRKSRQGRPSSVKPPLFRRKSINPSRLLTPATCSTLLQDEDVESRIAYEESRMSELMQYSTQHNVRKSSAKITYQDVNNYYPKMQRVSSASRTTDQLRWLLRLRMEQYNLLPGATHLDRSDIAKVMLPFEKATTSKSRKYGMVPIISQEKSESLCNSVFNRILSHS